MNEDMPSPALQVLLVEDNPVASRDRDFRVAHVATLSHAATRLGAHGALVAV